MDSASSIEVPGPKRWPVVGNPAALRGLLPFMEAQRARYGDIFRMKVVTQNMVALSSPDLVQRVLVSHRHNYVKGSIYDGSRTLFGHSLLTLEGEAWKHRRALAQPAFHRRSIDLLTQSMSQTTCRFLDDVEQRVGSRGGVIEMGREATRLTLEIVVRALFGPDAFAAETITYDAVKEALEVLSARANGVPMPAWVPRLGERKFRRALAALDRSVRHVIDSGRGKTSQDSLLSMLLEARDEQGQPLSEAALRDEVVTLFIAGHETSALAVTWMMCLLDGRPDVRARLRDEVDSVLGGRAPTFEDVSKLVYVRQVVDESLRLRPPVPFTARNVAAPDTLGGYTVRPGDVMVPWFWGVHRHPEHWPDPERFDPERFAPGTGKNRHSCSYLPFSAGPRICIGNAFALTEMVIILAQLFSRFEVEPLQCADVPALIVITTRPTKPMRVKLTPRRWA
jgi:cytochrome P450